MMERAKMVRGGAFGTRDVERIFASLVARADDPEGFAQLVALLGRLDDTVTDAAAGLLAAGHSYTDLARPLGVSRQAARQRWEPKIRARQATASTG